MHAFDAPSLLRKFWCNWRWRNLKLSLNTQEYIYTFRRKTFGYINILQVQSQQQTKKRLNGIHLLTDEFMRYTKEIGSPTVICSPCAIIVLESVQRTSRIKGWTILVTFTVCGLPPLERKRTILSTPLETKGTIAGQDTVVDALNLFSILNAFHTACLPNSVILSDI